jgi:hypothetical protein
VKRTLCIALLQLGLLAVILPASAGAKEIRSATICGTSGCRHATARELTPGLAEGSVEVAPPSRAAPWYRLHAVVAGDGGHGRLAMAVVPKLGLIRGCCGMSGEYNWIRLTADGKRAYARLTRDLDPFPAGTLRLLTRAGARAAHPSPSQPDPPPAAPSGSGAGFPGWGWIAIGSVCLIGLGVLARTRRRAP